MTIDYRLLSDCPLLRVGVFERITCRPLREDCFDAELEFELVRNGFENLLRIDDPRGQEPFSLMHVDEYLALLSFPGIVWFVSRRIRVEPRQAALAILAGMPWPLWDNSERQDVLLSVSMAQATLLKTIFKPTNSLVPILRSLPPGLPASPRCNAQNIWREIARISSQDLMLIRHVAKALRMYLDCLGGFLMQCIFSEAMSNRDTTGE